MKAPQSDNADKQSKPTKAEHKQAFGEIFEQDQFYEGVDKQILQTKRLTPDMVRKLQRTIGNQAVMRMLNTDQNAPEAEAVQRTPSGIIQRDPGGTPPTPPPRPPRPRRPPPPPPGAPPPSAPPPLQSFAAKPQAIWSYTEFKEKTAHKVFFGKIDRRGKKMKHIGTILKNYLEERAKTYDTKQENLDHSRILYVALNQLEEVMKYYQAAHANDSSRTERKASLNDFLTSIQAEKAALNGYRTTDLAETALDAADVANEVQVIRDRYEGETNKLFEYLAQLIDTSIPGRGMAKFEIELKIPVWKDPSSEVYLGGHMTVEAEKAEKTKGKAEIGFIFGGKISGGMAGIEGKGEAGMFFEAQANTSLDVMKLISYAMYRRMRASKIVPSKFVNYMWGGRGDSLGKAAADTWSQQVEDQSFGAGGDDDIYAMTGAYGALEGEAKAELTPEGFSIGVNPFRAKAKLAGKAGYGTKYTRKAPDASAPPGTRSVVEGAGVQLYEGQAEVEVGPFRGKYVYSHERKGDLGSGQLASSSHSLEVTTLIPVPITDVQTKLPEWIASLFSWVSGKFDNTVVLTPPPVSTDMPLALQNLGYKDYASVSGKKAKAKEAWKKLEQIRISWTKDNNGEETIRIYVHLGSELEVVVLKIAGERSKEVLTYNRSAGSAWAQSYIVPAVTP